VSRARTYTQPYRARRTGAGTLSRGEIMPILVGIDGTDGSLKITAARNRQYDKDFASSFVSRICRGAGSSALYLRGPATPGNGLEAAIDAAVAHVTEALLRGPGKVLLTGYSRGGAGVVVVASRLARLGIRVEAMMLFDAVDRHAHLDAYATPDNVAFVQHVMRSRLSGSRESFSNAAKSWPAGTDYKQRYYVCTHGGMGGLPYDVSTAPPAQIRDLKIKNKKQHHIIESLDGPTDVTYAQDAEISAKVWRDQQPFLRTHGFLSGPT
jgi:hypothetical protein